MKNKIIALLVGLYWGYLLTSIVDTVGTISKVELFTAWDAVYVFFSLFAICLVAVETYKVFKD